MRLTKFGHACVRVEDGDRVLVIDPGTMTGAEALDGATAVLVTHEHADHIDVAKLAAARAGNPALTVHTHPALAAELGDGVTAVEVGDTFRAAGFGVRAVGGSTRKSSTGCRAAPIWASSSTASTTPGIPSSSRTWRSKRCSCRRPGRG